VRASAETLAPSPCAAVARVGGADPEGHGLLGVGDRVAALGGRLRLDSRSGEGTVLISALPLPSSSPD